MKCPHCYADQPGLTHTADACIFRLKEQRDEVRKQAATATDLMVKGEALREKVMLGSILGGAYDTDAKKAQMVYLLTGKKRD